MSNELRYNLEAEQAVLGALFFQPDSMVDIIEILQPDDFYNATHQEIYRACVDLFRRGEPVDLIFVAEMLNDLEILDQCGGRPYLMDLAMSVATAENIRWYADKIKNYALRRQVYQFGMELMELAFDSEKAEDALEAAQSGILAIAQAADRQVDPTPVQLAQAAAQNIQQRLENPNRMNGLRSGFRKLDTNLRGLQAGKLIILGARPAMGKSGFALNIATYVAVAERKPVLFYSLEMEPVELTERALMAIAESETDMMKIQYAADSFPRTLRIIDRPTLTLTALRASILRNRIEMGSVGLVVIDYLQLMKSTGGNRTEEVSSLTRGLKLLAREFKIPIMALAQLSRAVETRQDKRPMLGDLRESGGIEQDADVVVFLYREEYYNKDTDKKNVAEVIIGKNRGGKTSQFEIYFRKNIVKFIDADAVRESRYDGKGSVQD